uniref:Uncharacterized protein n=1 Tax=Anguilla anguilla TaxID=7936 RepID=A0A0E9SGG8_ANGAN
MPSMRFRHSSIRPHKERQRKCFVL